MQYPDLGIILQRESLTSNFFEGCGVLVFVLKALYCGRGHMSSVFRARGNYRMMSVSSACEQTSSYCSYKYDRQSR